MLIRDTRSVKGGKVEEVGAKVEIEVLAHVRGIKEVEGVKKRPNDTPVEAEVDHAAGKTEMFII